MKRKKNKPGQGRKSEGRIRGNILMRPEAWEKLDAVRAEPRGKHIERLLGFSNTELNCGEQPTTSTNPGASSH